MFEQIFDKPLASSGIRPGGLGLTRRAISLSTLHAGSRVLDVGCGTGVTVEHLLCQHGIPAVGIDLSPVLVAQGRARVPALPLVIGDAEALPFADGSFDGVVLECTLSLVQEHEAVLSECHRVLSPLGTIILTDLYARNPDAIDQLRALPVHSCLRGALHKDKFLNECSAGGFRIACWEDHSNLLREFAVQTIWTYGSLDKFWAEMGGCCADPAQIQHAIHEARPGYFLYVGCKVGPPCPAAECDENERL